MGLQVGHELEKVVNGCFILRFLERSMWLLYFGLVSYHSVLALYTCTHCPSCLYWQGCKGLNGAKSLMT